jgi:hypothetical protein
MSRGGSEPSPISDGHYVQLTPYQAQVVGAYTGVLCGDFQDYHVFIEELLGRPVWTHELADPNVMAQIKDAARPAFMAICPQDRVH